MKYLDVYSFPKIFIEHENLHSGNRRVVVLDGEDIIELVNIRDFHPKGKARFFLQEVYEDALNQIIDLEGRVVKLSFIVYVPWHGKYMLIERGTELDIIEVSGKQVFLLVREGDLIHFNDKIATIITGKREARTFRSPANGVIVYISRILDITTRDVYIVLVAEEGDVRAFEGRGKNNTEACIN